MQSNHHAVQSQYTSKFQEGARFLTNLSPYSIGFNFASISARFVSKNGGKSSFFPRSSMANNAYKHAAPPGTINVSIKGGAFLCRNKN